MAIEVKSLTFDHIFSFSISLAILLTSHFIDGSVDVLDQMKTIVNYSRIGQLLFDDRAVSPVSINADCFNGGFVLPLVYRRTLPNSPSFSPHVSGGVRRYQHWGHR